MAYNLTMVGNSSGVLNFVQLVNSELMFGWFGVLILIIIASICFIAFQTATNDPAKSIAASAFISLGMALLLRAVDLIPNLALFIIIIACAGAIAIVRKM